MIDPGSVVLAGLTASLAAALAAFAFRRSVGLGVRPRWPTALLRSDAPTRDGVAITSCFAAGVAWALVYAFAWSALALPISAAQGAVFAVPHALADEALLRLGADISRDLRPLIARLVVHLAYGAAMGAAYRPGT